MVPPGGFRAGALRGPVMVNSLDERTPIAAGVAGVVPARRVRGSVAPWDKRRGGRRRSGGLRVCEGKLAGVFRGPGSPGTLPCTLGR
jgi:hypothetical protein